MAVKRLSDPKIVKAKSDQRQNRRDNAGQSWATLNTAQKFAIIGQDLLARGIIDTL